MLIAKGREIKEFSEIISIEEQITELTFEPEEVMKKKLTIQTFNADNGELLSNVLLRLRKTNSKISTEGLTKENGWFSYIVDSNCQYSLDVARKGFISYSMEFNQTKGNENVDNVKVPLFSIEKPKSKVVFDSENQTDVAININTMRAIMISDDKVHNSQLTFEIYAWIVNPENNEETEFCVPRSQEKFENNQLSIEFNNYDEFGKTFKLEDLENESNSKWFRLVGNVTTGEIVEPDYMILDHNFKNRIQDCNFKVMIFDWNKLINIIYAPSFTSNMTVWDIGLINLSSKKFLNINSFYNIDIERKTFMKFYLSLLKFLNEVDDNFNVKSKFGFDSSSAIHKLDDIIIQNQNDFIKAIQKFPIQWISCNIKDEVKIKQKQVEFDEFLVNLPNGYKNIFGEISFNKLMSTIGKHIGVHHSPSNKLNRSIVKSSRRIYF